MPATRLAAVEAESVDFQFVDMVMGSLSFFSALNVAAAASAPLVIRVSP